jgi:hypothetical protein
MKYIITENQYINFKKSVIRIFLRRVGHRIDEIVNESVKDTLNWYLKKPGVLHEMGPSGYIDIIIDDVWQYVYESYIEPDVEFGDEEQDIMRDYLFERYSDKIKEMYNHYVGRDLNESDDKGRDKIKFFQELIDNALRYIKVSCDKSYDEFPSNLYFGICDDAEVVRRINVLDARRSNDGKYMVDVRVEYYSIHKHIDMSDVLYEIEQIMKKSTGMKFWIYEKENINRNKNRQW